MKHINIILLFVLAQTSYCLAQTEMLNSQYIFEKTFVTPANYMQDEKFRVFTNYQTSTGQERAGREYIYSLAANFKADNDKSLVGLNLVNTKFGQESTLLGYLNYTYNLKLTENAILSNGFGLGFQQYRLDLEGAEGTMGIDPALKGNIYSSKFDFRIGSTAVLHKKTYFGLAFDNVLSRYNNQTNNELDYLPVSFKRINMTFMAGNRTGINPDFDIRYEGLYTYNFGGASSIDLNAQLVFSNLLGIGMAYHKFVRSEEKTVLSPNIIRPFLSLDVAKNSNLVRFNYAYGFSPNRINTVGLTTHEFGLTYVLK